MQGIVVAPTSELVVQIYRVARRLAAGYRKRPARDGAPSERLSVALILNESSIQRQKKLLRNAPPVVLIGVPQRLVELAGRVRALRLHSVKIAVIDEVDANLLSPDFRKDLSDLLTKYCMSRIGEPRQTIFASATVPQHNHFLRQAIQQNWIIGDLRMLSSGSGGVAAMLDTDAKTSRKTITTTHEHQIPTGIENLFAICRSSSKKLKALAYLLQCEQQQNNADRFIVFFKKSRTLAPIARYLSANGVSEWSTIVTLHDTMGARERQVAIDAYRTGAARVLLATDRAARGLDVPETSHVVNFDLPSDAEVYLHRVGRTGRIGRSGRAISLIVPEEQFVVDRFSNRLGVTFRNLNEALGKEGG